MKYNTNDNVVKLQMGKSIPDKRTQKIFDNVTSKILQNDSAKNRNISSTTGIRYEQPLKDIHPGLDLALMYAQPGNIAIKAFAPSMAKGFVEGLKEGDLQQAVISGLVPESKVTSIVKSVKKPISKAERLGVPKSERSNPKALEDPQYWGYEQWNQRYNDAVNSGNLEEVQKLRDLHFKKKAPDTKVVDENGMPLHTYHGTMKHFTTFNNVNPKDIKFKTGGYHTADYDLANSVYGKGGYYNPANGKFFRKYGSVYDDYLNITNPFIDTPSYNISDIVGKLTRGNEYPNWGSLNGSGRVFIKNGGFDGVFVPRYHNTYLPTNSASQIKSAEPITWNGKGEIIPIVKRDNFRNPDIRFNQGGILKGQNGTLTFEEWYKTIPKEYNDTINYNLRRAYQLVPFKDLEKWRKNPEKNHLNSVYKDENGDYEFLKLPGHPTLNLELDWYNKADKFKKRYRLDTTSIPWKYVHINKESQPN